MIQTVPRLAFWHQPIVALASGSRVALEWLVRAEGDTTANNLWQQAAQSMRIAEYEEAILNHLADLRRAQPTPVVWHINLHPQGIVRTIMVSPDQWSHWTQNLAPVVWELLEAGQWHPEDVAALAAMNQTLALDDWGDGPGMSVRLTQWPVRWLKLDLPLIQRAVHEARAGVWVRTVQSYAESQNIVVIAEGLETRDQVNMACELGIRYGQGWACGLPILTGTE